MTENRTLPVLNLEGTPRERGRIHGEALRDKIQEFIIGWKDQLYQITGIPADDYLKEFLEQTNFLPAIEKWTPDLLEEIAGIAEGAALDFETAYIHQLADEEWWYREQVTRISKGTAGRACSAVGLAKQNGNPTIIAQTLDLPDYCDGYLALINIKYPDSDHQVKVVTEVGVVAAHGLNNKSIGVCANTLSQLGTSKNGLPVDLVIRGALAQPTLEDTLRFIQTITHATGQNYLVGGPDSIHNFECSGNKVAHYMREDGKKGIVHTNHPMANDDQDGYKKWVNSLTSEAKKTLDGVNQNTRTRLDSLERQFDSIQDISVSACKEMLSSHDRKHTQFAGIHARGINRLQLRQPLWSLILLQRCILHPDCHAQRRLMNMDSIYKKGFLKGLGPGRIIKEIATPHSSLEQKAWRDYFTHGGVYDWVVQPPKPKRPAW